MARADLVLAVSIEEMPANNQSKSRGTQRRVHVYDVIRGLCVVSMVGFHYCYDLVELAGVDLPWFKPPFEDIWRASISWTFLFLAGIMCSYSLNNFKRAIKYGFVAFLIWAVTYIAAVDIPISFGIIFCMSASTLLFATLHKLRIEPRGTVSLVALVFLFLFLLKLPDGYLQLGSLKIDLPANLYSTGWISWLGFPGPNFSSGDYYPLLPYSLMFLAGSVVGPIIRNTRIPLPLDKISCPPLEFIGRHALAVYVVHQPVLLLLSGVAF